LAPALRQPFSEPALSPKLPFQPSHLSGIALVIVSQKVQKPMQSQNPKLERLAVSSLTGLAPGHAARNHDIAKMGARGSTLDAPRLTR
jgi:hypothetical protein